MNAGLRASWMAAALVLALGAPARGQDDPLAGEDDEVGFETGSESETESGSESESGSETETETESESESESGAESESESGAESGSEIGRDVVLHAAAGMGVGTISFSRPIAVGMQTLPATAFAALEVAVALHAWPEESTSLRTLLAYQSSVGLELSLDPLFALPEEIDVRAQQLEVSAAPVVRLGEGSSGLVALAFPIGFAFRAFVPEVHEFPVREYGLAGPQARAEIWLKLGELVQLRLGPEAQWIVIVDGPMRGEGACCQGVAIGAQGVLEASVGPVFRVAFAYHESRAFVPLTWRFKDVARFLTARIAGEL